MAMSRTMRLAVAAPAVVSGLGLAPAVPVALEGRRARLTFAERRAKMNAMHVANKYHVTCESPPCVVQPDEIRGWAYCSFQIETGEEKWPVCKMERPEHDMVRRHITPENTVMEFGARYGTTTCEISAAQQNSGKLVSVEPDGQVWEALANNTKTHGCKFNMLRGTVGTEEKTKTGFGHGTRFSLLETRSRAGSGEVGVPVPFAAIESRYGLKFDTLLIDCEGCVNAILDENPGILKNIKTIILEADMGTYKNMTAPDCGDNCVDYNVVARRFEEEGFDIVDEFRERDGDRANMRPPECCPWAYHLAFKRQTNRV